MTDAGWAEKKAANRWIAHELRCVYALGLRAEYTRSVRIVKAEIKRVQMDQHTYTAGFKKTLLKELQSLLAKFERGRGGKG